MARGACVAGGMQGGHAWQGGTCMAGVCAWWGGMHGREGGMHVRGHAWPGGHVWQGGHAWGVCMAGGACMTCMPPRADTTATAYGQ